MTIDLRSDTVTKPTDEMREAAKNAKVGDDVFGDDPTVNELERYAADLFGMEEALFVTSGTQGNLVSILSQTKPGDEVLLEEQSHIYYYEVGGLSAVGGTIPKLYSSQRGYASTEQIEAVLRPPNIHYPDTSLLCIENTHNRHGGSIITPDQVGEMAETAREHGLRVHMDGARFFNAVIATGSEPEDYTKHLDSIQSCLSKGLSAPIGSIVAGDEEFVTRARKKRKMLGGGMRQVGIIAAPALYALKNMRERLVEDHNNAKQLENGLKNLGLDVWDSQTNIVVCDVSSIFNDSSEAIETLQQRGVLIVPFSDNLVRMTTNRHISSKDIDTVLDIVKEEWIENQS